MARQRLGLAKRGANIIINYSKSADEAAKIANDVRNLGADVAVVQANVADDADCKLAATAIENGAGWTF